MRRTDFTLVLAALACFAIAVPDDAKAQSAFTKNVDLVQSPDGRPCLFVTFTGLAPWHTVPKTHEGYYEIFTILMTAKTNSLLVLVNTTGGTACGLTEIKGVRLE